MVLIGGSVNNSFSKGETGPEKDQVKLNVHFISDFL